MDHILEKLFESVPKVRILRLFMCNPEARFALDEIISRSQVRKYAVRAELNKLLKLGMIREGVIHDEVPTKNARKPRIKKKTVYALDQAFPLLNELRDLLVKSSVAPRNKILRQIKGIGKVKLAVISGVFIQSDNSRTDLLLVGDGIHQRKLDRFLADTESELGKSVQHTVMETDEFLYRMDMYDRFLRDILEYPHEKIINKFNL
ncbi:MAG: hypothetical protein WAP52_01380 [Candidatus Sungiibacteriota bacterium]